MRNLTVFAIAIIALFVTSTVFAVTAERGEFIALGRESEEEPGTILGEMIILYDAPAQVGEELEQGVVPLALKSSTVVQVLDSVELESGNVYQISTIGRDGGMIGWVNEDYIYEITTAPEE